MTIRFQQASSTRAKSAKKKKQPEPLWLWKGPRVVTSSIFSSMFLEEKAVGTMLVIYKESIVIPQQQ